MIPTDAAGGLRLADQTMCSNGVNTIRWGRRQHHRSGRTRNLNNPGMLMQVQALRNLGSVAPGWALGS